jgi:hypothetical protein
MKTNPNTQSSVVRILAAGSAAVLLTFSLTRAQNPAEQTAPALPVDEVALPATVVPEEPAATSGEAVEKTDPPEAPVTDYTNQIGNGLKERERRLTLLNEAMMKLREAGEIEDAGRVEERIRALLEMPAPSQASTKMRAEIEQLRAKNDELTIQLLALQEEVKRYRPNGNGNSSRETARNR